jgi:FkbM family methyltransferase
MRLITTNQGLFKVNVPEDYAAFNRYDNVDWIDYQLATKGEFSPIHSWIVENFVTEDSTVVDVGAHIGTFTIPTSKKAKRVYAFEPVIETFQRLTDHILINNSTNIIPFNFALGDVQTSAELDYMPLFNTGGATLTISRGSLPIRNLGEEHNPPKYNILVKPLDDLDLPALDVMKCDTEGCELLVIKGAIETIKKFRPVMILEHNDLSEMEEIMSLFAENDLSYMCQQIEDPSTDQNTDYLYTPL